MYVNAKAELVTLAPGLRPERRFAPLARGLEVTIASLNSPLTVYQHCITYLIESYMK